MNLRSRNHSTIALLLVAGPLLTGLLPAQPATNDLAAPHTNAIHGPFPLLLLSPGKPPVALFRELLAAPSVLEVNKLLAGRSEESRKLILAKMREYKSMKPDQRELRLRVTELRWYLLPLLHQPATNRVKQLNRIPADDRALVEDRLKEWDSLPQDVQKQLLENEATLRALTEIQTSTNAIRSLTPALRQKLQKGIDKWNQMPEEQRLQVAGRFERFFDLTPQEKQKALKTLSEPERQQMEKTLRAFGNLSPVQRAQCIRSFEKFASLSLEERQQFLKNAERWQLMSPEQRQAWRDLVSKAPLLPPVSMRRISPHIPPLPTASRPALPLVTNGN